MTHELSYAEIAALCAQVLTEDERHTLDHAAMAEAMKDLQRACRVVGISPLTPPMAEAIASAARRDVLPLRKPRLAP